MSYILDSIKKAERERTLGQQAPSISIEYSGEHVDQDRNNWLQWALLSLGVLATAFAIWASTYYFTTNKQQNLKSISEIKVSNDGDMKAEEAHVAIKPIDESKKNIAMVPVKNIHTSNLKTVEIITEKDKTQDPVQKVSVDNLQKSIVAERAKPEINKHVTKVNIEPKIVEPLYESSSYETKKINLVTDKQELAAIYSDLAQLAENQQQEVVLDNSTVGNDEVEEEFIEIKTANYVAPDVDEYEKRVQQDYTNEVPVAHKTAVSTGVPSFGELPYAIQEKIPDFNVSVHMFHADPSQRRIRINGSMYTEGKNLQQDLALVEITRYGAVFDYQGHLFRLNIR